MSLTLYCPACERKVSIQEGRRGVHARYGPHFTPAGEACLLSGATEGGYADAQVLKAALEYVERLRKASKANLPASENANAKLKRACTIRVKYLAARARLFKEA